MNERKDLSINLDPRQTANLTAGRMVMTEDGRRFVRYGGQVLRVLPMGAYTVAEFETAAGRVATLTAEPLRVVANQSAPTLPSVVVRCPHCERPVAIHEGEAEGRCLCGKAVGR